MQEPLTENKYQKILTHADYQLLIFIENLLEIRTFTHIDSNIYSR